MGDEQSTAVIVWWSTISAISVANVALWFVTLARFRREAGTMEPAQYETRRRLMILSALFVLGCGFRSFLPRAEAQRIGLYDSWLSSALIGRSVATVAELAIATQWTFLLREYAKTTGARLALVLSWFLVPLISMAEWFSWYTTLTTNFIGSVIEESTWAVTATLMTLGFAAVARRRPLGGRRFIGLVIAFNVAYIVFMWSVDVPMYRARWRGDEARGKRYLTLAEGVVDSQSRRIVTRRFVDWKNEMPWMSLYFSAGVWLSISLMRAPRIAARAGTAASLTPETSARAAAGTGHGA